MALLSARLNIGRLNAERLHWIGADTVAPGIPGSLVASGATASTMALSWAAAADYYGVAKYWIERCAGAACTNFVPIGTSTGLSFTDINLSPLSTYRYRVRAEDATGNVGGYSAIATATTIDRTATTNIYVLVSGVWTLANQYARVAGATVTQALNEVVDTAAITFSGSVPYTLAGRQIRITDAAGVRYFEGNVGAVRTVYEGRATNIAYECDCVDYTWQLNFLKVTARFTNQTVSAIIASLVSQFAQVWFVVDTTGITNNLTLDEITFTNEDLAQAISRTCERGGLYWYVDYAAVVRAFNSTAIPSAGTIDQLHPRQSSKLAKHDDWAAIATAVLARGNGAGASIDVAPGSTTLPVDDATWYGTGFVECGPQQIRYQGVSDPGTGALVGAGNAPSNTPTIGSAAGSNLGAGLAYRYAVSFVTASGETLPGPAIVYTPTGASVAAPPAPTVEIDYYGGSRCVVGGSYRFALEFQVRGGGRVGGAPSVAISPPLDSYTQKAKYIRVSYGSAIYTDPNVIGVALYRTTNGGGTFYSDIQQQSAGFAGSFTSSQLIDADVVQMPPMAGGSGGSLLAASLSQLPISARPGVTGRKLYRTAANGSQLKLLATINDNTTTTYLDTTVDGSLGANAPTTDTSGILGGGQINAGGTAILVSSTTAFSPAGGWVRVGERVLRFTGVSGSSLVLAEPLASSLSYGAEIVNAPHLTGIPASGANAIVWPIAAGDQVLIVTQVWDDAAITALANATGGSGYRQEFLTDGRLGPVELNARATALLRMRKDPLVTVNFETRDPAVTVGKTITFNTTHPPIVGTFLIQRVTISEFQATGSIGHPNPLRVVEASSRRYTFDDLVQQIKLLGRIN